MNLVVLSMVILAVLAVIQFRYDRLFMNRLKVLDSTTAGHLKPSWKETSIQKQRDYMKFLSSRGYRKYSDSEIDRLGDMLVFLNRLYLFVFFVIFLGLLVYFILPELLWARLSVFEMLIRLSQVLAGIYVGVGVVTSAFMSVAS